MPCNTAHYYYEELRESVKIPIFNMIELTAQRIERGFPNVKKAGLIATVGTIETKIYDRSLAKIGVEVIPTPEDVEKEIMKAIYDYIKAGELAEGRKVMASVASHLIEMGAQIVICGCTEVSLVLKEEDLPIPVVDPLQILAETAVEAALEKVEA